MSLRNTDGSLKQAKPPPQAPLPSLPPLAGDGVLASLSTSDRHAKRERSDNSLRERSRSTKHKESDREREREREMRYRSDEKKPSSSSTKSRSKLRDRSERPRSRSRERTRARSRSRERDRDYRDRDRDRDRDRYDRSDKEKKPGKSRRYDGTVNETESTRSVGTIMSRKVSAASRAERERNDSYRDRDRDRERERDRDRDREPRDRDRDRDRDRGRDRDNSLSPKSTTYAAGSLRAPSPAGYAQSNRSFSKSSLNNYGARPSSPFSASAYTASASAAPQQTQILPPLSHAALSLSLDLPQASSRSSNQGPVSRDIAPWEVNDDNRLPPLIQLKVEPLEDALKGNHTGITPLTPPIASAHLAASAQHSFASITPERKASLLQLTPDKPVQAVAETPSPVSKKRSFWSALKHKASRTFGSSHNDSSDNLSLMSRKFRATSDAKSTSTSQQQNLQSGTNGDIATSTFNPFSIPLATADITNSRQSVTLTPPDELSLTHGGLLLPSRRNPSELSTNSIVSETSNVGESPIDSQLSLRQMPISNKLVSTNGSASGTAVNIASNLPGGSKNWDTRSITSLASLSTSAVPPSPSVTRKSALNLNLGLFGMKKSSDDLSKASLPHPPTRSNSNRPMQLLLQPKSSNLNLSHVNSISSSISPLTPPPSTGLKEVFTPWTAPESWAVADTANLNKFDASDDEGDRAVEEQIRIQDKDQFSNPLNNSVSHADDGESDGERQGQDTAYFIRIYRTDGTYQTITCNMNSSASNLQKILTKKLRVPDGSGVLWIKERGKERPLNPTERPAKILRRRLEQAGFDDNDNFALLGKEDLTFVCRFIFKAASMTHFEVENDGTIDTFENVDLQSKNLQTVPIFLYDQAHTIVSLNFSKNPMQDLPLDFVQLCSSLKELRLSMVAMKRVPPNVRQLCNLTRLDISSNRIVELEHAALHLMKNLTSLQVQNNRLTNLPQYLSTMSSLKYLNISNNKFEEIPRVVCEISTLLDFDASFNTISVLPVNIGQLMALERFVIIGNNFSSLPESFRQLFSLREFDCRRSNVVDISQALSLPKLETLRADTNNILGVDEPFGPSLTSVDLTSNSLARLVINTFNNLPTKITSLALGFAKLSTLPANVFERLPNLQFLHLENNSITVIPEGFGTLVQLIEFHCHNNSLTSLPASIGRLQKLKKCVIYDNNLESLPASIWQCGALEVLNVSSNLLATFPEPVLNEVSSPLAAGPDDQMEQRNHPRKDSAGSVKYSAVPLAGSLRKLYICDNRLADDTFDFMSLLTELRVLNLSFNHIFEVPAGRLQKCCRLEELYLSGNKLTSLPADDLAKITSLRVLHVNSNKLQTLPAELAQIKNLNVLDVGSNVLKYNIANWPYDWNWNWNLELTYLNLSGNSRLEIKSSSHDRSGFNKDHVNYSDFSSLRNLRILGLMDITLLATTLPDEYEDRRIRTSTCEINGMPYGIADSIGRTAHLTMCDLVVPRFRGKDDECLMGIFDGKYPLAVPSGCRVTRFLHDEMQTKFTEEIGKLSSGRTIEDAMRMSFLRLNIDFYDNVVQGCAMPRKASNATPEASFAADMRRKMSLTSTPNVASQSPISTAPTGDPKGGAAAVVVYMTGRTLYIANAGNSMAVVSRKGECHIVSKRHVPFDREEALRIRAAEGWISPKGLVNDELPIARAFGYYHLIPVVNARPSVSKFDLTDTDEFLIIGNVGLWDQMSYQTAIDIARTERSSPMAAAQKIRDLALSYGGEKPVMVMVLNIAEHLHSNAMRTHNVAPTAISDSLATYALNRSSNRRARAADDNVGDRTLARLDREVAPPTGEVALVFTDIRNSTVLWESNAGMQSAMRIHNNLLRRQLRTIGGYEVKTEGDAFMVSFPSVTAALLWCCTVQIQLQSEDWPQSILDSEDGNEVYSSSGALISRGLRVRMGVHWGEPVCEVDPITRRMDYFGPIVNRASRVSAAADGGQIMVSEDFVDELRATIRGVESDMKMGETHESTNSDEGRRVVALKRMGFDIAEIGERQLKGLETPELLSLIYPTVLAGRLELAKSNVPLDSSTRQVYAPVLQAWRAEDVRKIASICLRLEALSSGQVSEIALRRKSSFVGSGTEHRKSISRNAVSMMAGSAAVLAPTISDDASDEELSIILDSILGRIDNALASLHLKQLGGYNPVLAALQSAVNIDSSYITSALAMYQSAISSENIFSI